ncbi:MAG: GNAT family N-acetyltransferase [Candidatus Omnitrophota bacterium]
MKIKVINNIKGLEQIKQNWDLLLENSQSNTIFLTWEWINLWWEVFQDGRGLEILTFWDKKELVGIAPFLRRKVRHFNMLPYERIEFLASGEDEQDEICSEYLNIIAKKNRESEVIDKLINYISENKFWEEIVLKELSDENISTAILLDRLKSSKLCYSVAPDGSAYYIDLPDSWGKMLKRLSSNFRYKINRDRKKLEQRGQVSFKEVKKYEELSCIFDKLIALHQKRWFSAGQKGCFASSKFTDFHRKMIKILFERDRLRLCYLEFNGNILAVSYDFIYKNNVYFYQSGFDMDFNGNIAVGNILRALCIEHYINKGIAKYDFLKGEGRHKTAWAATDKKIYAIRIRRRWTYKENIYYFLNQLRNISVSVRGFLKSGGQIR